MFNILIKSLLPKIFNEREAQNFKYPNIKPRFSLRGFQRLIILFFFTFFLLGYQPLIVFPARVSVVHAAESTQSAAIAGESTPEFKLPFDGYLSTSYSNWHPGIDIATGLGTPIHPIASGVVEEANFGVFGYGNDVVITHTDGFKSLYGHMDRIYLKKGDPVTPDSIIGTVGLTGFTSGPHTHLEVYKNGRTIDPQTVLPVIQKFPSIEYLTPYGGKQNNLTPITNQIQPQIQYQKSIPTPTAKPIEIAKPTLSLPFDTPQPNTPKLFSLPIN